MGTTDHDRDFAAFCQLLDLWKQENPIKTTKLQVLLAVNGALISIVSLTGGFTHGNWPILALGALLSGVWVLSIGRTTYYQRLWKFKLVALAEAHPGDPRFQLLDVKEAKENQGRWIRLLGGVSSRYYLLGAPIFLCLAWLGGLVYVLLQ